MSSFNVVAPVIASCLWLAACGARSGVQCLGDVCSEGPDVSPDLTGAAGASSTSAPPTRTPGTGSTDRPVESPEENEWLRAPANPVRSDPGPSTPQTTSNPRPTSDLCAQSSTAQGPITITTREELARLEGCRRVEGDLTVTGLRSRDLSPLSALSLVSGTLTLSMSGTLSGLENLRRVGHLSLADLDVPTLEPLTNLTFLTGHGDGQLTILQSPSLRNLAGLGSLRTLGGIEISGNARLETLAGLRVPSHLESILVASNPNLKDLVGLSSLSSFDRLDLRDNDSLRQLQGLEGVSSAASLHLSNSPALQDASALSQLRTLGSLFIDDVGLTNLDGFVTLRSVRDVVLQDNRNLTQVDALARLEQLDDLVVTGNSGLLRLPSFPEITVMDRVLVRGNAALGSGPIFLRLIETNSLTISENPRLTRVDGFPELRTVRAVEVSENQDLREVNLSTLEDVNRLRIVCNPNLPEASLAPLLSLGDVDVRGNLGSPSPCNSGGPP